MTDKVYKSVTGHTYPSTITGKMVVVRPGEVVEYMPQVSMQHELKAGNIVLAELDEEVSTPERVTMRTTVVSREDGKMYTRVEHPVEGGE